MSFINHFTKELHCKVVYFGPGLSGKTTNVQYVYEHTAKNRKGKFISIGHDNERTLFFDFLPLSIGKVGAFESRFHLYTIPGQSFYELSHQVILKGVDGIIFVADSQLERLEDNMVSLEQLEKHLLHLGYDTNQLPLVIQYNKRDLKSVASKEELEATLNPHKRPSFEAIACRGEGVLETLQEVGQRIFYKVKKGA